MQKHFLHRALLYGSKRPLIPGVGSYPLNRHQWCRGIEKVIQACEAAGIGPPELTYEATGLTVEFSLENQAETKLGSGSGDSGTESLGTTQKTTRNTTRKILAILRENPKASRREMAEAIGDITKDGVKYHLEKLKKSGVIERVGSPRRGYWDVKGVEHV